MSHKKDITREWEETVVEFGLEAIYLAEKIEIEKEVDSSRVSKSKITTAVQSTKYKAEFVIPEKVFLDDKIYKKQIEPITVTITEIKEPEVLKLQDAFVTDYRYDSESTEVEIIATGLDVKKLW